MTESHPAKCFHVKLPGNCQFSWRIERSCHRKNAIVWLTVNIIPLHLFSCLTRQIIHCFMCTEWHRKCVLGSARSLCVFSAVCLSAVASCRVQGTVCSAALLLFVPVDLTHLRKPFLFILQKDAKRHFQFWWEHPKFLVWAFISLF